MTERKLATIRQVLEVNPIPNADSIETVKVDGWVCVTKKGEFKVGDLGVYFEVDSFLPVEERYEFLRKACFKTMHEGSQGFRLRTMKLRKQLSQGLLLPISSFPELKNHEVGTDVTDMLGVKLFEKPVPAQLKGLIKGNFPSFIRKTDQERVQNLVNELSQIRKDMGFEITEKLDGTSCTFYWHNGVFGVCSRNLELKEEDTNIYSEMARKLIIKEKLEKRDYNIAIQGEIVGPGINKNPLKLPEVRFFVFNIYDIEKQKYLLSHDTRQMTKEFDLDYVPIIRVFGNIDSVEKMIQDASGQSFFGDMKREGLIYKSGEYINGDVFSFKVLNNDYLLEEE